MFRMCLDQWEHVVATFHANAPTSTKEPDQEFRSGGHPQPRRPPFSAAGLVIDRQPKWGGSPRAQTWTMRLKADKSRCAAPAERSPFHRALCRRVG